MDVQRWHSTHVELNVPLSIEASMFGGYLRYHVQKVQCVLEPQTTSVAICRNVFDVLMPAQDELFNDLVDFLSWLVRKSHL